MRDFLHLAVHPLTRARRIWTDDEEDVAAPLGSSAEADQTHGSRSAAPHIRSCHAKDIRIGNDLTLHLHERPPGQGELDFRADLTELGRLDPDTPLILEHLKTQEEYAAAAGFIRGTAREPGVAIR